MSEYQTVSNEELAAEALVAHLETCRRELAIISHIVEVMHDYHDPDKVNWAVVGDYQHLAEMLREARQFLKKEEDPCPNEC